MTENRATADWSFLSEDFPCCSTLFYEPSIGFAQVWLILQVDNHNLELKTACRCGVQLAQQIQARYAGQSNQATDRGVYQNNVGRQLKNLFLEFNIVCRLLKESNDTEAQPANKHVGRYFSTLRGAELRSRAASQLQSERCTL